MLFNSAEYLLAFLPICSLVYFWLNSKRLAVAGKVWLVAASLFFYAWWAPAYLVLMLASVLANFWLGVRLNADASPDRSAGSRLLVVGVIFNLGLLAWFKYAGFVVENANLLLGVQFPVPNIVLPLAVSFFTFTQMAYLVDCRRRIAGEYSFSNYVLFVTFFPHLIAGPILHHREMMPQFESRKNLRPRPHNLALGLSLISMGLFKKVVIADTFSVWATAGFDQPISLSFFEAWISSLSYTFQLYFDFSGYTDMALGSALLFNIRLPINFNSPYKARNIQEFWRRWHITLSRFLRDYLYAPLGGNRRGRARVLANLMITFVLGGLWHGASWMFVIWGGLHGAAMIIHRAWVQLGIALPQWLAWLITFNFVNLAWVFFRARDMADAKRVLEGMAGINGVVLPPAFGDWLPQLKSLGISFGPILRTGNDAFQMVLWMVGAFVIVLAFRNSNQLAPFTGEARAIGPGRAILCGLMASASLVGILASKYSEFIYFNF
ncbi:MAG TPA: MBOAT family protein [Nitrospira sp.]|nr:MBOAT family protein [Thauera aminoaromatica]HNC84576.1 MBOAT family protein [Nitrospira sp.]